MIVVLPLWRQARVLAATQTAGNATDAPWPFRVNSVTGAAVDPFGRRNGNMAFILRLYRALVADGYAEFSKPLAALWHWVSTYQIPSPTDPQHSLFVNFFEDQVR